MGVRSPHAERRCGAEPRCALSSSELQHGHPPTQFPMHRARAVRGAHHGPGAGAEAGAGENTEGGDENFVFEIRDEGVVSC